MKNRKIVVFDLDQTLGDFGQLSVLWYGLQQYLKPRLREPHFYTLLDIFPEFLRPNILNVLTYLKEKKDSGECYKVLIYTNNNGEKSWPLMIKRYLEYKIDDRLFDRTIAAYKARGKQIEPLRTTYDKTVADLQRCARLPQNVDICFVDDLEHHKMKQNNIFYIQIPAYHHNFEPNEMMRIFLQSPMAEMIDDESAFYYHMINILSQSPPREANQNPKANQYNGEILLKYINFFMNQ